LKSSYLLNGNFYRLSWINQPLLIELVDLPQCKAARAAAQANTVSRTGHDWEHFNK